MLEQYGFFVLAVGGVLALIAFVWLMVRAFRVSTLWGVGIFLFPPIGFVFIGRHYASARSPARLLLLACLLIAAPYAASYYERHFVPLAPYEQVMEDGERRTTLTGLTNFDYAAYRWHPDLAVVQMANADVTDATLEHLRGLTKLRSLDVSNSKITDAGLATIASLPGLVELRIANTAVTDEGFQTHLAKKASLLKLDLTGTEIKGKTKREWKNANPEAREYVD